MWKSQSHRRGEMFVFKICIKDKFEEIKDFYLKGKEQSSSYVMSEIICIKICVAI